ncbi:MAG: hypothetical protein LBU53_04150 [Zoogloeaceae bacterium]|jgi:hypothetical protein|nr:hypothetical protein [Zoogloeaceae bacterium]
MSFYYPLYVFDASRHKDILPNPVERLEQVEQVIQQLSDSRLGHGIEIGVNPRFIRLGQVLARHFPTDHPDTFWFVSPETELSQPYAFWKVEINDIGRMGELLAVLIPLARKLRLDVFDAALGFYLPALSMPVPRDEGSRFRLTYDPDIVTKGVMLSEDALQNQFIERLRVPLGNQGFKQQEHYFYFIRPTDGGEQSVEGMVIGDSCLLHLDICSNRFADIKNKYLWGKPKDMEDERSIHIFSKILSIYADDLRKMMQPAWEGLGEKASKTTANEEEINWMFEDVLRYGLPLMELIHTVDDVDWLLNSDAPLPIFIRNLKLSNRDWILKVDHACTTIIYARLAGNPKFDVIVHDLEQRVFEGLSKAYESTQNFVKERFYSTLEACRTHLKPIKGEIA